MPLPAAATARSTAGTSTSARSSSATAAASRTVAATTAEPSDLQSAQCYFSADVKKPDNSIGLAFGFKEGGGYDNTVSVENYLDACHQSLVSKRTIDDADPISACVLADGRIGLFPGTETICTAMGLPVALRTAAAPISTG